MTFRPLHIISSADGGAIALDGLPGHMPLRGPDNAYFGHEWARWRVDTFDEWVDDWLDALPSGDIDILDLGCATGARAFQFARRGHRVTGVDVVDWSAEIAMQNRKLRDDAPHAGPPVTFIEADLASVPQTRFDSQARLVHARRVLNFITVDRLEAALTMMGRALAPGGLLAVSFIAHALDPDGSSGVVQEGVAGALPLCPGLHSYQVGTIIEPLRGCGLTILEAFSDGRAEVGLIAQRSA